MVRRSAHKRIPIELVERINQLQIELNKESGLNVSFMNAGRAAAKYLECKDLKVIKVFKPHKSYKRNDKLVFEQ